MSEEEELAPFCPRYHHVVETIGKRWTGAVLRAMLAGCTRFTEIAEAVPGLSDRMLSERLRELEKEGIVVRTVTPSTPVQITYELTEKGRDLSDVVHAVADWAERWVETPAEAG